MIHSSFSMDSLQQALPSESSLQPEEIKKIVYDYFLNETHLRPQYYMKEIVYKIVHREPYIDELHLAKRLYDWLRRYHSILDTYIIELVLCMGYDPEDIDPDEILSSFELDTGIKLEPISYWSQLASKMVWQLHQDTLSLSNPLDVDT
jgi:hypothetical protein